MPSDLSSEEYQDIVKALSTDGAIKDDAYRTWALNEKQAYEDSNLKQWGAAAPPAQAQPSEGSDLSGQLDPEFSLVPQALAVQPATTHPQGDEAAEAEFLRKPAEASRGTVFVYEPPLNVIQKRLLDDPQFARALFPELPPDPEQIAAMTRDDSMYQAAADYAWRETADAAANNGKTAYRYSKAPWLHDGKAMSTIQSLGMKAVGSVKPASEAINSFVMGVDKTAALGALRAGQEIADPEVKEPNALIGLESAGGIPTSDAKEHNAATIEEHPVANMAGQALGMFSGWGAANKLYQMATGATSAAAKAVGGGLTARILAGGAGAALGGGAVQAGQDLVSAGQGLAEHGEAPIPIGEMASRAGEAAVDPLNVGLGAGGEVLGSLAGAAARGIGRSAYGGDIDSLKRAGGEVKFGKGPVAPPEVESILARAQAKDFAPVDVAASDIAPQIAKSQKEAVSKVTKEVGERKQAYYQSREGQMKLPVAETQKEALSQMRKSYAADETTGELRPIGNPAAARKVRDLFNNEVQSVYTAPKEGAIEMSVDEARTFLSQRWKSKLLGERKGGDFADTLKGDGIDTVYVMPRRYTAEQHEELKETLQTLAKDPKSPAARAAKKMYLAALKDRDARPLDGVPGGWSEMQNASSKDIGAAKTEAKLAAPGGDSFRPLVKYAKQTPGQLPMVEAVRAAAEKAGVRDTLDRLRGLDPLSRLQDRVSLARPGRGGSPLGIAGAIGGAAVGGPVGAAMGGAGGAVLGGIADQTMLRLGYPGLNWMGAPGNPLRGGMAGRLGAISQDEELKGEK